MKTYQTGLVRDPNNATLINEKRTLEMALDKLQRGKEHLAAVSLRCICQDGWSDGGKSGNMLQE
jgi:hypothetical protein